MLAMPDRPTLLATSWNGAVIEGLKIAFGMTASCCCNEVCAEAACGAVERIPDNTQDVAQTATLEMEAGVISFASARLQRRSTREL